MEPSAVPSEAPTYMVVTVVTFDCAQSISGCTAADLTEGSEALAEVVDALTLTLEGDEEPTVVVTGVEDITLRRRMLAAGSGVLISYTVSFAFENANETAFEPATVFEAYKTQLTTFVATGNFTTVLQSSGLTALANAVSSAVTFSNFTVMTVGGAPTGVPTETPNEDKRGTSYNRAGLIAGVVLGVVFAIVVSTYCFRGDQRKIGLDGFSELSGPSEDKRKKKPESPWAVDMDGSAESQRRLRTMYGLQSGSNGGKGRDVILSDSDMVAMPDLEMN